MLAAAGAGGRRRRRAALRSTVRPRGRAAPPALLAGAGARADPGRGADVPVQQPRRRCWCCCWSPPPTRRPGRSRRAGTRWLAARRRRSSGFAFLTKMLQAFLVLPAVRAGRTCRRADRARPPASGSCSRRRGAAWSSGGWWVALVELWPAASRPYIGGSTDNSVLDLILGYNGLGRHHRRRAGPAAAAAAGGRRRLRRRARADCACSTTLMGGQISWLLPAALVALVGGLWHCAARARTDPARASLCCGAAGWSSPGSSSPT